LSLGLQVPGDIALVNELLLLLQPAHLEMHAGRELAPPQRDELRATLARERLAR
jgi:protein-arginine kinase